MDAANSYVNEKVTEMYKRILALMIAALLAVNLPVVTFAVVSKNEEFI